MSNKKLIIGIDGGGTKTTCILFDSKGNTIDALHDKGSNLYVYKKESLAIILGSIHSILEKNKFNIEEFSFNPIPGPFLDGLTNTRKLLDNHSENISFNQS